MDFASILASEISKKRKTTTSGAAASDDTSSATASSPPPKKYQKRSEIEAQRAAAYLAEQNRLEQERREKAAKKRAAEAEAAAEAERQKQKRLKLAEERRARLEEQQRKEAAGKPGAEGTDAKAGNDGDAAAGAAKEQQEEITEEDAIRRLRAMGQPATLFGESPAGRIKRLKREERKRASATPPPAQLTEEEMRISPADITENPTKVYTQLDAWFRLVLREWKRALDARPDSLKESLQGRKAADAMRQADEYMKPLFEHFKRRDLAEVVYEKVSEIVVEAQNRRYVKANDVYLRLSIGNAAWPIGVTMVGIHERSAREKLHENRKEGGAHIMSDEVTRKFLQSIKRCLSFCQTRWPPEDPLQLMG